MMGDRYANVHRVNTLNRIFCWVFEWFHYSAASFLAPCERRGHEDYRRTRAKVEAVAVKFKKNKIISIKHRNRYIVILKIFFKKNIFFPFKIIPILAIERSRTRTFEMIRPNVKYFCWKLKRMNYANEAISLKFYFKIEADWFFFLK